MWGCACVHFTDTCSRVNRTSFSRVQRSCFWLLFVCFWLSASACWNKPFSHQRRIYDVLSVKQINIKLSFVYLMYDMLHITSLIVGLIFWVFHELKNAKTTRTFWIYVVIIYWNITDTKIAKKNDIKPTTAINSKIKIYQHVDKLFFKDSNHNKNRTYQRETLVKHHLDNKTTNYDITKALTIILTRQAKDKRPWISLLKIVKHTWTNSFIYSKGEKN